ncbi:MAG: DoxX family protein [Saprospiraceae bacterium]|nr:DoxX family protein [Saprospiraceae bacterium]
MWKSWIYPGAYGKRIDFALLLIRLFFGLSILTHGYKKFNRLTDGNLDFSDPIGLGPEISLYLAVLSEFFCSLLLILGLFTRLAVIPLLFTMMVIIFIVHATDSFGDKELPILYSVGFFIILLLGGGKLSLDHKLFYHT